MTAQLVAACHMVTCPECCHTFRLCLPSIGITSVHQHTPVGFLQTLENKFWSSCLEEIYRLSNHPETEKKKSLTKQREWENQMLHFEAAKSPNPKVTLYFSIT